MFQQSKRTPCVLDRRRPLRVEPLEKRLLLSADLQLASVRGVAQVDGEDVVVQALYAVDPGADAQQQGVDILAGYGARPFQSVDFSVYGWAWDQFFDMDTTNDFVTQFYNPGSSNTKPEPSSLGGLGGTALLNSQATWTNVETSTFAFKDGGITDRCPSLVKQCKGKGFFDGFNDVAWLRLEPNVFGVTWYGTSIRETDVALSTAISWSIGGEGNSLDVETTFLHENGHVVGLRHSSLGTVMYYTYTGPQTDLSQDDIDGISFLYPVATDPVPGITVSPTAGLVTSESGVTATFTVVLDTAPTADVTIGISSDDTSEGMVDPASLTFTTDNWDTPQTVTVTGVDDDSVDGNIAYTIVTAAAVGGGYDGIDADDVSVTNTDNDGTQATTASVSSITYATKGGKNGYNNLTITVGPLSDDLGSIVSDASVRFTVYLDSDAWYNPTLTTGADGTFSWTRNNVAAGTYTIIVTNVTADGLIWDGITPPNSFTKPPSNSSGSAGLSIVFAGMSLSATSDIELPDYQHTIPYAAGSSLLALAPEDSPGESASLQSGAVRTAQTFAQSSGEDVSALPVPRHRPRTNAVDSVMTALGAENGSAEDTTFDFDGIGGDLLDGLVVAQL